jgi:hypothetical protein
VANATWAQVSQVRTKGGEPVATLAAMIDASAAHAVPLVVEVKTSMTDPASWVDYAEERGADVRYYRTPTTTECRAPVLDQLRDAGAVTGMRLVPNAACQMTAAQIAARGASFISQSAGEITPEYTGEMHAHGVSVYVRKATAETSQDLMDDGSDRLIVSNPQAASGWPS